MIFHYFYLLLFIYFLAIIYSVHGWEAITNELGSFYNGYKVHEHPLHTNLGLQYGTLETSLARVEWQFKIDCRGLKNSCEHLRAQNRRTIDSVPIRNVK